MDADAGRVVPHDAAPLFCSGGGCTAKLGPRALSAVLAKLPRPTDENLLVGFDSSDDAAVIRLTDDLAVVHTLDFFPPVVADPYTFGRIAAANALSDVWAMGGRVSTALNIVAFPEDGDLNQLGTILAGGSERVAAAGASLAGGHSITGDGVLYGLSVTGTVHPGRLWRNDTPRPGDALVLTKPLGVGIACAAHRLDAAPAGVYEAAVESMVELNLRAAELLADADVHAVTDVTGFGLAGHLLEMLGEHHSAVVDTLTLPLLPGVKHLAEEFFLTAAAQRNRAHAEAHGTRFDHVPFGVQEVLFDAQTSGGLLVALPRADADAYVAALAAERAASGNALPVAIIGTIAARAADAILVR